MSPIEQYVFLRSAGFSHPEAYAYINMDIVPAVVDTEIKKLAIARIKAIKAQKQGVK